MAEFFCILALIVHTVLACLVLSRSIYKIANLIFGSILFLFSAWSLAELYLIRNGLSDVSIKLLLTPMLILPMLLAKFSGIFPRRLTESIVNGSWTKQLLLLLPCGYMLFLVWTDKFPQSVENIPSGILFNFGENEFVLKGIVVIYLLISLKNLIKAQKSIDSEFLERRFRYTFFGLVLPAAVGSLFVALGRLYVSGKTVYTFGVFPGLCLITSCLIAYAILKYQLMEIDIIFSIGLIYTILTLMLAGIMELLENFMQSVFNLTGTWNTILITLLVAAGFAPLKELIAKLIDKIFGKKEIDPANVITHFLTEMRKGTTPHTVFENLLRVAEEYFGFSMAAVKLNSGLTIIYPQLSLESSLPLPDLPNRWFSLDELDAIIEAGQDLSGYDVSEYIKWKKAGFRHIFPIFQGKSTCGGLFLAPKKRNLPYSQQEKDIIVSILREIPPILENLSLLHKVVERERIAQEIEWTRKLYLEIQANPNKLEFNGRKVRFFSALAKEIKGDLIDSCEWQNPPFIAVCDAFHHGIQAALTLHIIRSGLRAADKNKLETVHHLLREFSNIQLGAAITLVEFLWDNSIRITNAGNIPPVKLGQNSQLMVLSKISKPVGLEGTCSTDVWTGNCQNDEILLIATNGLAKVFGDSKGEGLQQILKNLSVSSIDDCHNKIQKAIEERIVISEFPDDITYVLIGGNIESEPNKKT